MYGRANDNAPFALKIQILAAIANSGEMEENYIYFQSVDVSISYPQPLTRKLKEVVMLLNVEIPP